LSRRYQPWTITQGFDHLFLRFAHGVKNKLAVSDPNQYKNGNHLRSPMNPTQSRKG
jgi:hypothetical protein